MVNLVNLSENWGELPSFEPILIESLLCRYENLLINGPEKSCKTTLAMQLAIAAAEGTKWLHKTVFKSKVLFVNLNSSENNCQSKFKKIYAELGLEGKNINNIDILTLSNSSESMLDETLLKAITENKDENYRLIIIDSIDQYLAIGKPIEILVNMIDSLKYNSEACMVITSSYVQEENPLRSIFDSILNLENSSKENQWKSYFLSKTFKSTKESQIILDYPVATLQIVNKEKSKSKWNAAVQKANVAKNLKSREGLEKAFEKLTQNDEPVNVYLIAEELGISRSATYKRVEKHEMYFISDGEVHKRNVVSSCQSEQEETI